MKNLLRMGLLSATVFLSSVPTTGARVPTKPESVPAVPAPVVRHQSDLLNRVIQRLLRETDPMSSDVRLATANRRDGRGSVMVYEYPPYYADPKMRDQNATSVTVPLSNGSKLILTDKGNDGTVDEVVEQTCSPSATGPGIRISAQALPVTTAHQVAFKGFLQDIANNPQDYQPTKFFQ